MPHDEWFALGSGLHRVTWHRTFWETAGASFPYSLATAILVTLAGLALDAPIVIGVGATAGLLLLVLWLTVGTSEYLRHR